MTTLIALPPVILGPRAVQDVFIQAINDLMNALNGQETTAITIAGALKITSGSPGASKVLTSDADGDATWEPAGTPGVHATTHSSGGADPISLQNLAGAVTDAQVPNTITLDNITQITTRLHSSLGSLTVDDHTQYPLLEGRATGQTIKGGTAASEALTLWSTAHATKGKILLGAAGLAAYDEANTRLGIGTNAPATILELWGVGAAATGVGRYHAAIFDQTTAATGIGGTLVLGGYYSGVLSAAFAAVKGESENTGTTAGAMVLYTRPAAGSLTERLRIDSTGIVNISGLTASRIVATDASSNIVALSDATYPSLTELSYVKGVISGIQAQLNLKAPLASPTFTGNITLSTAGATVDGVDLDGAALTKADDTNVTLTLGGSPTTSLLRATSLTLGWTGQLAVSRGGTGLASYTIGDIIYASGVTTLSKLADIAAGNALIAGGVGIAPSWGKINLTSHVTDILPIINGGTGGSVVPVAGGVAYGAASVYAFTAAGTTGYALISGGTGSPTWTNAPTWGSLGLTSLGSALILSGAGADITFNGAGLAQIITAVSQHLALMPGGNVGIKTITPAQPLDVNGASIFRGTMDANGNIVDNINYINDNSASPPTSAGFIRMGHGTYVITGQNQAGNSTRILLDWGIAGNNILRLAGDSDVLTIPSNVGIGTTEPFSLFDINGLITGTLFTGWVPTVRISQSLNNVAGVEMRNTNSGVAADFRFIISDNVGDQYIAFTMPGTGNTGSTLFGQNRNAIATVFVNSVGGGTDRLLVLGTVHNTAMILGTNNTERIRISNDGKVGIGVTVPTAAIHLKAGTTAASTAPLKFTSGPRLTTPEAGAVEFLTDAFYATITTGAVRRTFAFLESPALVTPALGTPTSGVLTSCTGLPIVDGTVDTLTVARGGTNIASYAVGDILYASGATTLAKLADIATGNALISGGVGVAPSWGKIGLTTHITGNLPVANMPTGGAWTLSSDLNIDSNTLVVDRTNNRIGSGTASPTKKLSIWNGPGANEFWDGIDIEAQSQAGPDGVHSASVFDFRRSRDSAGSRAIVVDGDDLGNLYASGYQVGGAADFEEVCSMDFRVIDVANNKGRVTFNMGPKTSATARAKKEVMRITFDSVIESAGAWVAPVQWARYGMIGGQAHVTMNLSYDGTNWNRDDTSVPGSFLQVRNDGKLTFYTTPAAVNPATMTQVMVVDISGNMTVAGTMTVNGDQTGATDHVFDDQDDIALLHNWRAGKPLPFATGDLLNRDRLLRDSIVGLHVRIVELETELKQLKARLN